MIVFIDKLYYNNTQEKSTCVRFLGGIYGRRKEQ